jgi:hypothetical protein
MVAALNGIIFHQIYGDNSGGAETDTDGDGVATQEDEFVSIQNTTGAPIDLSGWEIWSDAAGGTAPDTPQDGLFHTFPPGTVLEPGKILHIFNEYSGTPTKHIQEASEGGVESGAGGVSTNFLSEGSGGAPSEGIALVDPVTGDYIVVNFANGTATNFTTQTGFTGTNLIAETNAAAQSGVDDMNAGSAYVYNSGTDSYDYQGVQVLCFAAGTRIAVPGGETEVQDLAAGDLVDTLDHGPQLIRKILSRRLDFAAGAPDQHKPIEFKPGSLGPNTPSRRLVVSPQHRMLLTEAGGAEVLVPAKALTARAGVRRMRGRKAVVYYHLVFSRHEIVQAESTWTESFFPGAYSLSRADIATQQELEAIFPLLRDGRPATPPARKLLRVAAARRTAPRLTPVDRRAGRDI